MFDATFTVQNKSVAIGPFATFAELETAAKARGVFCEKGAQAEFTPGGPGYAGNNPGGPGTPGGPGYAGNNPGGPGYAGGPGGYAAGGNVREASPTGAVVGAWRAADAGVQPRDYANPGMGKYGSGLPGSNPGDPNDSSNMEAGPVKDRKMVEERVGTGHYPATDIHKYPVGDPRYAGGKSGTPGGPGYAGNNPSGPGNPGGPGYAGNNPSGPGNPGGPGYAGNNPADPRYAGGKPSTANPAGKYSASFTLNGVAQTIGPFSSFTDMGAAGHAKGVFCANGQSNGEVRQTNINGVVVGSWACA